jgi:hypothetical protein
MHEDPGMNFAFILRFRLPDEFMLELSMRISELYLVCQASGVISVGRPFPNNGVFYLGM